MVLIAYFYFRLTFLRTLHNSFFLLNRQWYMYILGWFNFFLLWATHLTQCLQCHTDHRLLKPFLHWSQKSYPPTILSYYINDPLCSNLKSLVGRIFATNAKMVLTNDDQGDIADIVLDVWLFDQKSNHPNRYSWAHMSHGNISC